MNRKAIFIALANLISNYNDTLPKDQRFRTITRRPQFWDKMPSESKPALIIMQTGDTYEYQTEFTPAKTTLEAKLLIYTAIGQDPNIIPVDQMNDFKDTLDACLAPSPVTGKQTLNGTVEHCRIEGGNPLEDGALDGLGVAIVSIKIFLPVTGV